MNTTMNETATVAATFVARLRANTEAFFADEITHVAFQTTNREIWNEIHAEPNDVRDLVLAALRAR